MFGEVFDGNPAFMSQFTTTGKLPATLDFGFQGTALGFASSKPTTSVRNFYAGDDYYTDTDSNAYELPTFLGNHDIGRIGMMLDQGGLRRSRTSRTAYASRNDLMYLTRGQPVVYYGDEQGFTGGTAATKHRQAPARTCSPRQTPNYDDDPLMTGGTSGMAAHYDTDAGCTSRSRARQAPRRQPGPRRTARRSTGTRRTRPGISRSAGSTPTTWSSTSWSRTTRSTRAVGDVPHLQRQLTFKAIYGAGTNRKSGKDSRVTVTVPPLSVQVFKANGAVAKSKSAPPVSSRSRHPAAPSAGAPRSVRRPRAAGSPR